MNVSSRLPGKWFIGTVVISLGAHALMLHLPLPKVTPQQSAASDNPSPADSIAAIALEPLPVKPLPIKPLPIKPLPEPDNSLEPDAPPIAPVIEALPTIEQSAQPPASLMTENQPQEQPPTPQLDPSPTIDPNVQQPNPTPTPSPQPTPTPTPAPATPEHGMVVALAEGFPHFTDVQSGCFSLTNCHRISGQGSYRKAAKQLVQDMADKGYQVSERDDIDSQGHRVYEVVIPTEPEVTYYLNVFSDSTDSMVYAMTLQIVTLAELQQLAG